jgi:subtilisin family serine protease
MRIKSLGALLGAAVVTTLSGGVAPAAFGSADPAFIAVDQSQVHSRWFIELAGRPAADGNSLQSLAREKQAFRDAARASGIVLNERYAFDTLWNGFSVDLSAADLAAVKRLPGVKAIYPVVDIEAPVQPAGDGETAPDMFSAITQTGADLARSELGLSGKGIKVAVIDTGIDYHHPDLGGGFGPGYKVAYGYDFVGDDYNAATGAPAIPDPDPDDCNGHGTHVAGIVGAKAAAAGGVTGVAPEVTLGAYRVFGCAGSSSADIIIAALERAYKDGMQVINQSLGAAFQWPQYPTATVGDRLVKKGVVVVASAGNNGQTGTFSNGAPGVGTDVIGVASFDNAAARLTYFTVNGAKVGYQTMTFSAPAPTAGSAEIVYIGQSCNADALLADPAGKTALAVRGTCSFAEKALKAINAGATAVVIHNNVPGVVAGTLGAPLGSNVPVVGISQADGLFIRAQSAPVTMTWTDQQDSFPSPTANLISSFSSYGLSPDLALKPDVGAPGGGIYSTYPIEAGAYAVLSGTSMSAPHVAGAVALLLEARPGTRAADVRAMLQNTADPKVWSGNPPLGFLEPVHRQGAGMLDIDDTILSQVMVSPGKLSLGESESGPQTRTLTITNSGSETITLNLSSVNALTTNRVIAPSGTTNSPSGLTVGHFLGAATVTFSAPSVVVPAGSSATVQATITAPASAGDRMYGGYIVMTPAAGGAPYRVPFAGYIGDYQSIQPLNGFNGASLPERRIRCRTVTFRISWYTWVIRCVGSSWKS